MGRQAVIQSARTSCASELETLAATTGFVTRDLKLLQGLQRTLKRIAPSGGSVLIRGDTGTGKEVIAQLIHRFSPRGSQPLVDVNCAAVVPTLLDSLLFGHVKGAFTGAVHTSPGKLAEADGSTLFLDELGDMPLEMQTRLLRFLETGIVEPLGGTLSSRQQVDVRFVAATNRPLEELIDLGEFRKDLYYRLKCLTVWLPPLRERPHDIALLIEHFLAEIDRNGHNRLAQFSPEAIRRLEAHNWPGNVRELKAVVEALVIMIEGPITAQHVEEQLGDDTRPDGGPNSGSERTDSTWTSGPFRQPGAFTGPSLEPRRVLEFRPGAQKRNATDPLADNVLEEHRLRALRKHRFIAQNSCAEPGLGWRRAAAGRQLRVFMVRAVHRSNGNLAQATQMLAGEDNAHLTEPARQRLKYFLAQLQNRVVDSDPNALSRALKRQYRGEWEAMAYVTSMLRECSPNGPGQAQCS